MKHLYLTVTALLMASQVFAAVDLKKQNSKLSGVLALEQKQEYFEAVLTSAQASAEILNQLQVDEVVTSVESKLNEIRNEVVTKHYSNSGSFSFLFGLISGGAQKSWDSAEIITANPQEVDGFSAKISSDFRTLQSKLIQFVVSNENSLAYAKAFALKTAQLAVKLSPQDRKNLLPLIKTTIQFSQELKFFGAQSILKCVQTNYADRSSSENYNLGGLLLSFGLSKQEDQTAHTTQNCSSSVATTETSESILISSKLNRLDVLIASYQKQLGLLEVVETKAEPFQTWGSPHYKK
jgi:hypothetical protein